MTVPYDDFCKRAIESAKAQSAKFRNGYVGTEHLLMGLLEEQGEFLSVLQEYNVDIENLKSELETAMKDYEGLTDEPGPHTPRLRKILAQAQTIALTLMESRITEKIMVRSMLTGGIGTAVRTLTTLGLSCEELVQRAESMKKKELKEKASWMMPEQMPVVGHQIPRQFFPNQGFIPVAPQRGPDAAPMQAPMSVTVDRDELINRDLTWLAFQKKLGPIFGRDREIDELCVILRKAKACNPVIVGEEGVGKTSVVEGLALRIAAGRVGDTMTGIKILEITRGKLNQFMGASRESEEKLVTYLRKHPASGTLFVFDGIAELIGDSRLNWNISVAFNAIRNFIDDDTIRAIFTVGAETYGKVFASDPIFTRKCERLDVEEMGEDEALKVLREGKKYLESHHRLEIPDSLLTLVVELSKEYLKDARFPGKAMDMLDAACALADAQRSKERQSVELEEQHVLKTVAKRSGLPIEKVSRKTEKFRHMEDEIRKHLVGQDEAIKVVCDRIKLFMTGLHEESRPLGVLFFAGPTGVGKTELARLVASYLFGSDSHFYRFDMSEYSNHHEVSRLVGAPPGYLGHEEEGQLTGKVRKDPYCVILLDEVEKAHPRVFEIFLQVFDAGRLTDSKGVTVDFRNCLIIMTSNIGTGLWEEEHSLGFRKKEGAQTPKKEKLLDELKKTFSPEFVNRLHETVIFRSLSKEDIRAITSLIIDDWKARSRKLGVDLSVDGEVLDFLSEKGFSKDFGARNMKRTVENLLVMPLSKLVMEGVFVQGDSVKAGLKGDEIVLAKSDETAIGKEQKE